MLQDHMCQTQLPIQRDQVGVGVGVDSLQHASITLTENKIKCLAAE